MILDIQHIGTRFYTYIATMGYAMEEATRHYLRSVALDRPNPVTAALLRPQRPNRVDQFSFHNRLQPAAKRPGIALPQRVDLLKYGHVRLLADIVGGEHPLQIGGDLLFDDRDQPVVMTREQLLDRGAIARSRLCDGLRFEFVHVLRLVFTDVWAGAHP